MSDGHGSKAKRRRVVREIFIEVFDGADEGEVANAILNDDQEYIDLICVQYFRRNWIRARLANMVDRMTDDELDGVRDSEHPARSFVFLMSKY